ncbi:MAG TPA: PAS domain S-box protein [Candidatus Deferrimicrobiaceae bacterium]|jgi:PAS domain S-box-containing protein
MDDLVTIPAAELAALRERVTRLSREKAHYALVNDIINRLGAVAGLDDVVDHILTTLMNTIGGANLLLYYRVEEELFLADVYGRRERITEIEDPLVREVFLTREASGDVPGVPRAGLLAGSDRSGAVWLFPLLAGNDLIGVFKMEGMLLEGSEMRSQLQVVFHYAAMTLRGEIQNYSRLRAAFEALRHSEERFRSVVDTAHDGILLIDGQGRVVFWNQAAEAIFGYTAAEAGGRDLTFIIPEASRDRHLERFARLRGEEEGAPPGKVTTVEGVRKDGSAIPLELSLASWRGGGEVFCTAVVRDIRERRAAEEALRFSEEQLRQAMKMEAVGRLAGGVAHDFNNLLTVINGYGEMVLRRLPPDSPIRREIEEIRLAGVRAAALTQQLLAFSRRQVMQPRPLDLDQVVRGMVEMLRRLIGEDILLTVDPSGAPCIVMADEGQVAQVVANLAVNARDAMPEGGKLAIRIGRVTPDAQFLRRHPDAAGLPHAVLSVSDTGCGMDSATRAHLFEPFFTTKSIGKGTGLGLSTVYGIVSQSGGHIEVESKPGEGSVFSIFLPVVADAIVSGAPTPGDDMPRGSETILFVEDEPAIRALVREVLGSLGYTVIVAENGVDALERFEGHPRAIDLLVTDVVMPRMNGRELASRLQERDPRLRLLFISGYTDHDSVRPGSFPPGSLFLQKPFAPDVLARKVREALADRPTFR